MSKGRVATAAGVPRGAWEGRGWLRLEKPTHGDRCADTRTHPENDSLQTGTRGAMRRPMDTLVGIHIRPENPHAGSSRPTAQTV